MKDFFQSSFLRVVAFCSYYIGKLHMPFARKLITGTDFRSMNHVGAMDGDLILSRTNGEVANIAIPGELSHIGIVRGNTVYEASTQGVRQVDIIDFFMNKDVIVLMRPSFLDSDQIKLMMDYCHNQLGKPYNYDMQFAEGTDSFFCSALAYKSIIHANPQAPFTLRKRFGVMTVAPEDFYKAKKKFILIWKSASFK